MPLHIEELICNVTVTLGAQAMPLEEGAPVESAAAAAQAQQSLELPRTLTRAESEGIMASTVARQTRALAAEGAVPPGIDPKALADRVYRLMREELELARERE